jgi:Tol biopolymer transport system component
MNNTRHFRNALNIITRILIFNILVSGCSLTNSYPKVVALGSVNGGFEISVLDLDSGTRHYVTNSKVIAPISYSYCAVKKQIAYSAYVENGEELIFQDLNNAHSQALTHGNNHFRFPVWSPDCSLIAFSSYESNPNLFILNHQNSTTYPAISEEGVSLRGASWSPNAQFISTYIPIPSQNSDNKEEYDLGVIDVTTNKLAAKIHGSIDYPFSEVAWSAENSQFYFSARRSTPSIDIYRFDVNTGKETSVINTEFDDRYPVLSPDGKYLSFLQSSPGEDFYNLGLYDLSTKNIEFVTNNPKLISSVLWSDNQRLILSEYNLTQDDTIFYAFDFKTKALKEIARFDGRFTAPEILQQ